MRALRLVQRDAGANPRFVDVEINAHHFALAHPDEIVHESRIAIILRPDKHHPDFGLRFLAVDCRHKRRVIDFLLQNPFVSISQGSDFLARWFHVHAEPRKGVKRLQNVIIDLFARGKLIGEKSRSCMLGFQEWQRMLANPKIPVRMADPRDIEIILKPKNGLPIFGFRRRRFF